MYNTWGRCLSPALWSQEVSDGASDQWLVAGHCHPATYSGDLDLDLLLLTGSATEFLTYLIYILDSALVPVTLRCFAQGRTPRRSTLVRSWRHSHQDRASRLSVPVRSRCPRALPCTWAEKIAIFKAKNKFYCNLWVILMCQI